MTDRGPVILNPGDIFFTRGSGLISRAIRLCTRAIGESRTQVNHVGLIVRGGPVAEAWAVEALSRVRQHGLYDRYGPPCTDQVAVYRPVTATPEQIDAITRSAIEYTGRAYGILKIAAHFVDWLLCGAYAARRLTSSDNYPICSWVVAHAYAAAGISLGAAPGAATPDDIWDHVTARPGEFLCVLPLGRLA